MVVILFLLQLHVIWGDSTLFVDKGNPYQPGKLNNKTLSLSTADGAPMHTTVIYPQETGLYPLLYFIPGAPAGLIPAEWYTDLLTRVSSHGFVVAAADAFWPVLQTVYTPSKTLSDSLPDRHIRNLNWLKENLNQKLFGGSKISFNHSGLACHSAGCDVTLGMIQQDNHVVNSTIFLEPFSVNIKKSPGISLPAYMYGTQFSEQLGPFPCSIPGVDYNSFFNVWGCPRWLTEVASCVHDDEDESDILEFSILACHIGHFCKTVGNWSRVYPTYHQYASGAMSAFLIGTLQGYTPSFTYIQDPKLIPLQLLKTDSKMSC